MSCNESIVTFFCVYIDSEQENITLTLNQVTFCTVDAINTEKMPFNSLYFASIMGILHEFQVYLLIWGLNLENSKGLNVNHDLRPISIELYQ
jgi:hypothetical protein